MIMGNCVRQQQGTTARDNNKGQRQRATATGNKIFFIFYFKGLKDNGSTGLFRTKTRKGYGFRTK
jgi:hypothetical protein